MNVVFPPDPNERYNNDATNDRDTDRFLPDALWELATQLQADAQRLARHYPPSPPDLQHPPDTRKTFRSNRWKLATPVLGTALTIMALVASHLLVRSHEGPAAPEVPTRSVTYASHAHTPEPPDASDASDRNNVFASHASWTGTQVTTSRLQPHDATVTFVSGLSGPEMEGVLDIMETGPHHDLKLGF